MKTIYSGTYVEHLIHNIQAPLKQMLNMVNDKKITLKDTRMVFKLLKGLMELPEPTKENTRNPNSHILIDIRDEFFSHLSEGCYGAYQKIFKIFFNYAIAKYDYDRWYEQCIDWCFGEALRRGWQLQGYNRPSSCLWYVIKPATKARLVRSITDNYNLLQERCRVIDEKLDSEENRIHKASRFDQFINRVLTEMEQEVETWRG